MKTYDVFLEYYDKIVRSINNPIEDEVDFLVHDCIEEYKPETKTILELACWTWVVAKELMKKWYDVVGLDINEKMLEKAKKIIWNTAELVLWDMTNFDLKRRFDCVLCNYNSICHLLTWQDWQNCFEMTNKHLDVWWLFIFDINTIFEFESITRDFAQFYNFWEDSVCLEMYKKSEYYEWLVKIFKKADDWRYDLIQETIKENSFSIDKIKQELKVKGFAILDIIDYHYWELSVESERVYFVCKKEK